MRETCHGRACAQLVRAVACAFLGFSLNVPLWGAPAPPKVDAPLFDCAESLVVRGYDSGATLRVYVDGVLRGTRAGATGYSTWVDLTVPLQGGQEVEATQEVGGVESARLPAVPVAAPDPPPPIYFEPPVEACARGGYVHKDLAGKVSVDSSNGDQLASDADNARDFPTFFSRPLAAGESLTASVEHCRLGGVKSPATPVTDLYGVNRGADLPTPLIDAGTAVECLDTVLVEDVIPGATVRVFDGATLLGEVVSTTTQAWVDLSAPMFPTWQLRARQELCKGAESGLSPVVQPTPLAALGPPVLEAPVWEGQQHVWLDVPVPAPATVAVDGSAVREDVEVFGHSLLYVEKPFVAGQEVSAFFTVCGQDSPPAQAEVVAPPKTLPPPMVGFPLFACTNAVSITGLVDQAEVVVLIDGTEVHHGFATGGSASLLLGPMLKEGQDVTAYQKIGPIASAESQPPVKVFAAPDLPKPRLQEPLHACQRSITVEDVVPGAWVTVYVEGAPFAYAYSFGTAVEVGTLPLSEGWSVEARQELNVCKKSGLSDLVTVGPPTEEHDQRKPEIVEPLLACQTVFEVRSLAPGSELDIFVDGLWKKRVPVSGPEMLVGIQPPLQQGQKVRVQPSVCNDPGELFDEAGVQKPKLAPPVLVGPVFRGDPSVEVSGAPWSSLVKIYDAANGQIGAGMGGSGTLVIPLSKPAQTGGKLTATASLCGQESAASAEVEVRPNRPPLPHDTMVSWFWLDAGNKAQALLQVVGRNVYKGSVIRIDGKSYPTFPMAQIVPGFGRVDSTLGTPIDTIGSVLMLLFEDTGGKRFHAGQQLFLAIDNPDGSSSLLQPNGYRLAVGMDELDSDGDGLTDAEESPGATLDLSLTGADPLRKDLLVEVDWMVAADHTHEPNAQSFELIRSAFASAHTLNADGSRGIHLFVDMGQNGGQGGDELSHVDTIAFDPEELPLVLYDELYNNNFAADRKGLFHYCVFGHQQPGTASAGIARVFGDKLIVTLINGGNLDDPEWIADVAATFMHELGHNLDLRHGGNTRTNYKPNYPSVMNYLYPFDGISTDCDTVPEGIFSYSYGLFADLDETDLDEARGICDGVAQDWDGDFNFNPPAAGVTANINDDTIGDYFEAPGFWVPDPDLFNEVVDASTTTTDRPLHDYCDWCFWTPLGLP